FGICAIALQQTLEENIIGIHLRSIFDARSSISRLRFLPEVALRAFLDDGKQFDLAMWKYALEVKGISPHPLIGHDHRPNRHAFLMGVQFDTNSKGLRDREFSYEKPPGKLRIMMLGDSFTVGWGAKFDETFSKRIERCMRIAVSWPK